MLVQIESWMSLNQITCGFKYSRISIKELSNICDEIKNNFESKTQAFKEHYSGAVKKITLLHASHGPW